MMVWSVCVCGAVRRRVYFLSIVSILLVYTISYSLVLRILLVFIDYDRLELFTIRERKIYLVVKLNITILLDMQR